MPTHDRAELMLATLASALAQRDVDLEVVVVDDGSTDDTLEVLAQVDDDRLRVVRHGHARGVGAARNTGIREAHGEWVAPLDDDDLWAPGKLAAQLAAARASGRDWVVTLAVQFLLPGPVPWVASGPRSAESLSAVLPTKNAVPGGGSGVLARRDAVLRQGGFDPDLSLLGDWDMWLKLLRAGPPAVVNEHLVGYRLHPQSMSARNAERVFSELAVLDERYRDLRDGHPLKPVDTFRWFGMTAWRSGDRAAARRWYLRGARAGDRAAVVKVLRSLVPVQRLRRHTTTWPEGVLDWLEPALGARPPSTV
ncbi:MAG: glycosyltransferase family 2 protein [Actinobacteria bacterium]|nr:glycosyltransferase family 2 protein [Actinomycetota bacterium]